MEAAREGKLIIVPTPIGNLGDVTVRMREALEGANAVCAEDTRVTGKLLAALGISKRTERLDETVMGERAEGIVARVAAGETIAYCSDAGMPGVSDPGLRLVAAAREAGVAVEVLPGPSAVDVAYVTSGTTDTRFYFGGFLPRKAGERAALLESLRALPAALIFYESPNRLVASLESIAAAFPHRRMAVCRELTKLHEEVVRGRTGEVLAEFAEREAAAAKGAGGGIKGEIALVINSASAEEAAAANANAQDVARDRAATLRAEGASRKDIAKALVREFGIPRNRAYEIAGD